MNAREMIEKELSAKPGKYFSFDVVQKAAESVIERLTRERDALLDDSITGRDGALAQIKELSADVERLRALLTEAEHENIALRCRNISQVIAEWRNENDKLRALLRECLDEVTPRGTGTSTLAGRIRAALGEEVRGE